MSLLNPCWTGFAWSAFMTSETVSVVAAKIRGGRSARRQAIPAAIASIRFKVSATGVMAGVKQGLDLMATVLEECIGASWAKKRYEHDEAVIRRLVEFLQTTDFAGVSFSRTSVEGTFPLDVVRLNTTNGAPDVIVSFRWFADRNENGAPGMLISGGGTTCPRINTTT